MRFERISIPAYGRFENMELAFPPAAHDLQVIYGPNEAGKSTLQIARERNDTEMVKALDLAGAK